MVKIERQYLFRIVQVAKSCSSQIVSKIPMLLVRNSNSIRLTRMVYWENTWIPVVIMALLIVFKSLIGCTAAEGCRVWLQGLAWVWPGLGQGLAAGIGFRDWLQSRVAGLLKI